MLPNRSTETEVVGIYQFAFVLDLLAFDPDVGNPVLSATVRASGDVQLQVLIEAGKTFFEFFNQPAGEGFGSLVHALCTRKRRRAAALQDASRTCGLRTTRKRFGLHDSEARNLNFHPCRFLLQSRRWNNPIP